MQPDTPAIKALEMMARDDLNQLPVIDRGVEASGIRRTAQLRQFQAGF